MQPGTYFGSNSATSLFGSGWNWLISALPPLLRDIFSILIVVSILLSVLFIIGIVYCVERLKSLREKEAKILNYKVEPGFEKTDAGDQVLAHRWGSVVKHMESANQNDWRQAIIEADIILDDILTKMGYRGESVGEKLKRVDKGDFASLDAAWDAHKVRNQIAHEGSNFKLDEHEARRVIQLYKIVFEEFYYI